jgi:formate dehydrogenase subunit delta
MINNIAAHFAYLRAEQAAAAVADHIKRFWDPRMKQRLLLLADSDTRDLTPVAVSAAALLR